MVYSEIQYWGPYQKLSYEFNFGLNLLIVILHETEIILPNFFKLVHHTKNNYIT